ncbi:hypothetical protein BsWGS_02773 [Bradybaena similaris]
MDSHPPMDAQDSVDQGTHELPPVSAAHVYVLMKKNTRVSRNIRACWFFRHLRKSVTFTPLLSVEGLTEDLTLVSVIPHDNEVKLLQGQMYRIHIGPDTGVTFLSSQYRLSFTLDLSPSMMSVDIHNAQYVYEGVFKSLSKCLRGLVLPLRIPGSDIWYSPELYISVICHTPVVCSSTNQVLVQGVKVNQANIDYYLRHIERELVQYEAALTNSFASLLKLCRRRESFFLDDGEEENAAAEFNLQDHMGNPEAGFTNMLRYGILALQLLPENSSSGIVVLTDGIVGLPSSSMVELLLNRMRNNTIMCSFIKVGSPSGLYRKLSHVPHIELMQAISTATFGAYLGSAPGVTEEENETNLYHRAMLFWSFQRGLEGFKYDLTHYSDEDMPGSISWIKRMMHRHPITGENFGLETLGKERDKRVVVAGIHSVLSMRLREGYTIKSVSFKNDNTEIVVKLHFPWRDYGKIEYTASAAWPLESAKAVTNVVVTVEGGYDLLHEMICKPSKEQKSALRVNNIKTLWAIIERIASSDQILEHLQSFSSRPIFYHTPECIRSGVPLFYIQQEGPSINMQLESSSMEEFAAFWKAVIQLDTSNWQKWLHSHRIGLVLEHDRQFPKYFQVPNASSRFTSIQCRQALASLSVLLREWSTFVLAENHSYIKFLHQDQDKPPKFFCVLRLTSKAPNMIIRLGFLGGTAACLRLQELETLRDKIRNLRFPQRGTQKTTKRASVTSPQGGPERNKSHKSPLNREGSEIACCVILKKPVEKILVVYESKPRDMTVVKEPVRETNSRQLMDPMRSVFRTITHYLQHQRWVWTIQANSKTTVSMSSISRMLATITRLRLQEGFHFAVSGSGVNNLVLEVDMKESGDCKEEDSSDIQTCVVQYIIFPPHIKAIDDSLSEDDQETETTEADSEVQIVTECWVEPQYGVCCNNTPERQHFNGLTYLDIAKAFYPVDYECVSSLTTFEHLVYLCENSAIPSPDVVVSRQSSPPSTPGNRFTWKKEEGIRSEPTVNIISFPFDLQSLLPRSQQAEILFSTFVIGDGNTSSDNVVLDPKEPSELLLSLFYDKLKEAHNNEILLSADDCFRFVQHVLQRPRDPTTNPVPFAFRPSGTASAGSTFAFESATYSETDHETTDASSTSNRKNYDSRHNKKARHQPRSKAVKKDFETPKSAGGDSAARHSHSKKSSPSSESGNPDSYAYPSQPGQCPMWKCYVKKDVMDHLLITFVPASFDDLLMLNPSSADASPEDTGAVNFPSPSEVPASEDLQKTGEFGSEVKDESIANTSHHKSSSHVQSETVPADSVSKGTATSLASSLPYRESRNNKVQEWVNTSTHTMKPVNSGPLLIPVFVYSCELKNVISSLVDRWTFTLPEDIFEDMSFKTASPSEQRPPHSPGNRLQSFDLSTDDQDDRDSWRSSLDRRSTDSNSYRIESFREHCKMITEMYFNSFVRGVFLSLQQSYFVDSQDVDSAINNICEESHPLETDMTTFLLASCTHMQQLVNKARLKERCHEEGASGGPVGPVFHKQHFVRFQDDVHKEDENPRLPDVLQLPTQSVEITEEEWASLSLDQCHQLKEYQILIDDIEAKFHEAIGRCLRPVPTLPDFYFYCPNVIQLNSGDALDGHGDNSDGNTADAEDDADGAKDEDIIVSQHGDHRAMSVGTSMESNHDESSLDSFEGNVSTDSVECDPVPLFVHFTCTLKQKSNFQHTSLRTVPLCFGQITSGLEDLIKGLDFSGFKVTFDINCLALLADADQPTPRKPMYMRLLSNTSEVNGVREAGEEKSSTIISSPKPMGDPVSHLSKPQHAAIYGLKNEIESLMQEEVVSALRRMHPVTTDTLVYVADYIRNTAHSQSRTVMYQCIGLQFVYGPDQSLNMFIEEFERQSLPGYKLTKEGDYYFLIVNKALTHQLRYVNHLHKSDFPHFVIPGNDEIGEEDVDGKKLAISKEERSYSLPCVFTGPSDSSFRPRETRSFRNTGDETTGSEPGAIKQRPRSCSDAKSTKRSVSVRSRGNVYVKPQVSLPEANTALEAIDVLRIQEEDKDLDSSLKKSSSFAGLQATQVQPQGVAAHNSRSRHCSAPSGNASVPSRPSTLPQSPSVISSGESTTDDGFEGDISDMELDETASVSDISTCYPELPDFWLLMQIYQDRMEVFFHSRKPIDCESPANMQHQELYSSAIKNIFNVCRKVNQALLLKELNKTKICNALLVPEADEDFIWTSRRTISGRTSTDGYEIDDEEDSEEGPQGYLAASMDLIPGYFACAVVWRHYFTIHPRLKHGMHGMQRGGPPMGVLVLRSILNKFIVTNRKNMFVIEELSSKNVFYLRLKELQMSQEDLDIDASLSDSVHFNPTRQFSKPESDTVSVTSSVGRQNSKMDDVVELTVHGIEEVGKEIKDDLMKMLQNKLDDALLDTICLMLSRNPQCKLKPDDISFIQKPKQEPLETLLLTIPGHCSMYLVALMYYLRQNLLQFLHTPNYVDSNPACQFQDFQNDDEWTAIPLDKVYLYVRPQPSGGKGIATVSVRLVDGQGTQVKLLNCPCPSKNNMPSLSDPSEFDKYVQTTVHERSTSRPGPTALIQFRIWECGNCDVKVLREKLMAAVRHALCDIVMEFFMLTTPICSVPRSLIDMYAQAVSSLPASPTKAPPENHERKHNALTRKMSVDPPRSMTNSKSVFNTFLDFRSNSSGESAGKCLDFKTAPATDQQSQPRTPASLASRISSSSRESLIESKRHQQNISQYENGEVGQLHPVFCSLMVPWMAFCHSIGVPSMTKTQLHFQSKFSVDFVIKELQQSIPTIASDTVLRIFKVTQTSTPSQPPFGVPFTPCKVAGKVTDAQRNKFFESPTVIGSKISKMAIGRNLEQWQNTVQDHQDVIPCFAAPGQKTLRGSQKFMPQFPEPDKNQDQASPRLAEKDFVPRQKLLTIFCQGKEMTLLMYNWSSDLLAQVEKTATRLIQWNNARSHILDSIVAQKMGLFHHFAFSDLQYLASQNPYTQSIAEVDVLIRHHAPSRDYQRRNSSISNREREQSYSRTVKRIVPFDQTFKNLHPPKLLEKLVCSVNSDPVARHGIQTQELKLHSRQDKQHQQPSPHQSSGQVSRDEKIPVISIRDPVFQQGLHLNDTQKCFIEEEERSKLYRLYLGWSQTNWKNSANTPITEDFLVQLKRAGRLFHYCATPLVFSTSWRQNVVHKTTGKGEKARTDTFGSSTLPFGTSTTNLVTAGLANAAATASAATTPATPDRTQRTFPNFLPVPSPVQTRSRHSSGASNVSVKAKLEEPSRKGSEAGLPSGFGAAARSRLEAEEEEQWHVNLRQKFMKEYKQYLISELGFIKLNTQPSMQRSQHRTQGSSLLSQGSFDGTDSRIPAINLQKTLTGGIILMELSFRQEFFCVRMFAVDCSQLGFIVNQQMHLIFVDECDKYKDLIHVHSFAHDFHLRCVMKYLSKQEDSVFPTGFDLNNFLTDFKQIYPYPPSFSRNCMKQDCITLPDLPFPGNMLYEEHMLKQMGVHEMRVFRMGEKFALVKHDKLQLAACSRDAEDDQDEEAEVYDAGLVIINNSCRTGPSEEPMKLILKYFTVLTRQRDCYPIRTLEKAFGEFRGTAGHSTCRKKSAGSEDLLKIEEQEELESSLPVPVRQHIGMRKEHVNYRGYSNVQQFALFSSLLNQSTIGREKILEMVEMSKQKCRRDYLWQRLLTSHSDFDDGRKRRVDADDTTESVLSPLSSHEFCELLKTVTISSLWEIDAQLSPLFHMPHPWYRGLFSALANKYPGAHRCFSSPDKQTQYIVVLNANNLDMFAMLSVNDSTEQTDMCMVMKEPVMDEFKHSPDKPNLPLYSLQTHVEDFVNVCCWHCWTSMIV